MDVATLVKSITTAFEHASTLVKSIRRRKEDDPAAQLEGIDNLLSSLSLGPTIVRGYYDSDAKRFGSIYMAGDSIAVEQLKDALINLQMTVLSSLGTVALDDKDPDYDAIQAASDDCRTNVGVCLGMLSQRMSKAVRGNPVHVVASPYETGTISHRPMQRSDSYGAHSAHSSQSSHRNKAGPMTPPPESESDFSAAAEAQRRQQPPPLRAQDIDVMNVMHSHSYSGLYSAGDNAASTPPSVPRSSLLSPPRGLESPVSPQELIPPPLYRGRESSVSTSTTSSRGNQHNSYHSRSSSDGMALSETAIDPGSWNLFPSQQLNNKPNQWSELTSATLGKQYPSANTLPVGRKPVVSTYNNATLQSPISMHSYGRTSSIPEEEKEVYIPPSIPVRSMSRSRSLTKTSSGTSSEATQRASIGPLNLPTDKNLLGFCKGAFRIQAGMEKAFKLSNRPLGGYSMLQYWKCDKCYFEGQCSNVVPPGGKKPEKIFDPVIRDHSGIRYKWAFLAKSHVPLKSMPEGRRDGLYGAFGCIFCTAEAAQRGWPTITGPNNTDRASIRSSCSINSGGGANTVVFGNIHGLMDHLQMHRQPDFWPGVEMQGRMKCIVGRVAQRGEEFDINLLPIVPE